MALHALVEEEVDRVVLARPAVEAGKHLGFLPGDFGGETTSLSSPLLRRYGQSTGADGNKETY